MAASSFFAALMFYAGAMYASAYYAYFRVQAFSLGFSFFELVLQSLRLITMPVLITMALAVLAPKLPELLASLGVPRRPVLLAQRAGRTLAGLHPLIVLAGICLMALWPYIQPYRWAAPVLVASGLLLGQTRAAQQPPRPSSGWRSGLPIAIAGLFLIWAVALAAGQQGRQEAEKTADLLVRRTAVVLLSTERLAMSGPSGLRSEDLGEGQHYRYRYSGLRLLVERDKRYYLLPLGWQYRTDSTYVIEDDDSIRVELYPGTQPPP
ncbi:hypothetical protein ABZW18_10325 [Streptomyces sp. NPDC004647]|uniref:hypothetical protein n=1 Tax=Streptomyces sp. NPDC004647 TaxID=3154671 RepID=UPI0033B72AD3